MRSRTVIESSGERTDNLIIEVLLDIRDVLSGEKTIRVNPETTNISMPTVKKRWANMNRVERKEYQKARKKTE